jgi:hypothetical protein
VLTPKRLHEIPTPVQQHAQGNNNNANTLTRKPDREVNTRLRDKNLFIYKAHTSNMPTEPTEPNDLHDQDDAPIIDGLHSSSDNRTPSGQESKPSSTEALRTIKTQREQIRKLQRQLQRPTEALYESEQTNVDLHDTLQATLTSPVIQCALETPGPHRLQARAQRPEDITYQERLQQQSEREQAQQENTQHDPSTHQPQMMLDIVKQLAKAMKETNHSDITEPSKFSGADHHTTS